MGNDLEILLESMEKFMKETDSILNNNAINKKECTGNERLFRADELQPLDIILTRPNRNLISKGISTKTSGKFSHASIVVSKTLRFESINQGITITPVKFDCYEVLDNTFNFLEDISEYKHFEVYRHPNLIDANDDVINKFQDKLKSIMLYYYYMEYPAVKAFEKFFKDDNITDKIAKKVIDLISNKQRKVNPGPFCSQLVAIIYESLGLELFHEKTENDEISPNSLANSNLVKVSNLVLTEVKNVSPKRVWIDEINSLSLTYKIINEKFFGTYSGILKALKMEENILKTLDFKFEEFESVHKDVVETIKFKKYLENVISNDREYWKEIKVIKNCYKKCEKCKDPFYCDIHKKMIDKNLKESKEKLSEYNIQLD